MDHIAGPQGARRRLARPSLEASAQVMLGDSTEKFLHSESPLESTGRPERIGKMRTLRTSWVAAYPFSLHGLRRGPVRKLSDGRRLRPISPRPIAEIFGLELAILDHSSVPRRVLLGMLRSLGLDVRLPRTRTRHDRPGLRSRGSPTSPRDRGTGRGDGRGPPTRPAPRTGATPDRGGRPRVGGGARPVARDVE